MKPKNSSFNILVFLIVVAVFVIGLIVANRYQLSSSLGKPLESPVDRTQALSPIPVLYSPIKTPEATSLPKPKLTPDTSLLTPGVRPPEASATAKVFPTVKVEPTPKEKKKPPDSAKLWYASYPTSVSTLTLEYIWIDASGQRWDAESQESKKIKLMIKPGPIGVSGGFPNLDRFRESFDEMWVLQSNGFGAPSLINLNSGLVTEIKSAVGLNTFVWLPNSSGFVALPISIPGSADIIDTTGKITGKVEYSGDNTIANQGTLVSLVFVSDTKTILSGINFPPTFQLRELPLARIVKREENESLDKVIFELPNAQLADGSLTFVTENKFVFVANVYENTSPSRGYGVDTQESQAWVLDIESGEAKRLASLSKRSEYVHPLIPISRDEILAIIVDETKDGKDISNSLHSIELNSGKTKQLFKIKGKKITNPSLSPNKQRISFTLNDNDFAEVWLVDINGKAERVIAGPTSLNAPTFWTQ